MNARLAVVAPDLVARLGLLSDGELGKVVAVVAREAVAGTGLEESIVASALDQIGTGRSGVSAGAGVREVVARLDEVAWESDEGHESERYSVTFQRARAASAVAFALDPDRSAALEAIYEAQAALWVHRRCASAYRAAADQRLGTGPIDRT